jgi:hypothetical protein
MKSQKRRSDLILHLTSSSFNFYLMNIFSLFLQIWWKKIEVEELEWGKHRIGRSLDLEKDWTFVWVKSQKKHTCKQERGRGAASVVVVLFLLFLFFPLCAFLALATFYFLNILQVLISFSLIIKILIYMVVFIVVVVVVVVVSVSPRNRRRSSPW